MKNDRPDHPFLEVLANVAMNLKASPSLHVHQKFTCEHCGNRLTMDEPNRFYTKGTCDKCGGLTDIWKHGMNIMLVISNTTEPARLVVPIVHEGDEGRIIAEQVDSLHALKVLS